ncbi:MAG TPA: hypothetical protein EYN93_07805 [Planctomycetaceae bacterium]|nr:hypothetical protein [Planctomycetaceae bacterium]
MQRIKSISRLSSLLILAIISLSGCSRLGESIAQVLPANEVPLITAAVSQTSNSAVALKPEGFVQADMNTEYDELMLVDDLEEEMDFLDMAEYAAEIDDLNSMAAEEEVYGGDRGITALLYGEDFEMMIRDMPKEDPYKRKSELPHFDIIEEYLAYHGYSGRTMQRPESREPSQRARKTAQQKPTYPNIREYLKNRLN